MIDLTIIIPNYNKAQYIGILLEQLKQQYQNNIQIIVIEDASTDNSKEIIDKYKDICEIYYNKKNMWLCYSRNIGIQNAKGKYLTFIDSDDEIKEDFVSTILQDIKTNHDAYFYDYDIISELDVTKAYNTMVWSKVYKTDFIKNNNIYFDENYYSHHILGEDLDFNCHVIEKTQDIIIISKSIIDYRWGIENSVSNSFQLGNKNPSFTDAFIKKYPDIMDKYFK